MFNDFSRLDMESEEIPGFTLLAMDVPKIVIIHDEKTVPDWLRIYISLGGCFLIHYMWQSWVLFEACAETLSEQDHLHQWPPS